jgi:hypothetical protein
MQGHHTKFSNGQPLEVTTFTGEVVAQDRYETATVHQSDPTIVGKYVIPGAVYSENRMSDEVWLRSKDGIEKRYNLGRFNLPLRTGHVVSVAQLEPSEVLVGAYNHATKEVRTDVVPALCAQPKASKLKVNMWLHYFVWLLVFTALGAATLGYGLSGGGYRGVRLDPQLAMVGAALGGVFGFFASAWTAGWTTAPRVRRLTGELEAFVCKTLESLAPSERR